MTRREALKKLLSEWRLRLKDVLDPGSPDPKAQTRAWIAAAGIPAAAVGLALCPRATVLICAALWIWSKIEEKRK